MARKKAAPPEAVLVIPFRDRGRDPLRRKNLDAVLRWWDDAGLWPVHVVSDGRKGDAQFNRSAAYNRGAELAREAGASVVIYTEADMLIPWRQVSDAVAAAAEEPGLVVPFTQYRYHGPEESRRIRQGANLSSVQPESTMENGQSMGAANVVSLEALDAVGGWDENFEGNWYDDNAAERAFAICCGPRRHVRGPGFHLYHLPGWTGDHLTEEDRAATEANRERWERYVAATTPEEIRALTGEGRLALAD